VLTTEYMDIHAVTDYVQAGAGVAGVLNGAKIIFGTNELVPGKLTVVADITQSVDAGLAPASVAWGAAGRDAAGDIVTLTATLPVQLASSANACVLTCWGLTDSGGTNLLMSESLEPDRVMNLTDNLVLYNVQVPFAPGNPQGKLLLIVS
jgi:hypothetical protein